MRRSFKKPLNGLQKSEFLYPPILKPLDSLVPPWILYWGAPLGFSILQFVFNNPLETPGAPLEAPGSPEPLGAHLETSGAPGRPGTPGSPWEPLGDPGSPWETLGALGSPFVQNEPLEPLGALGALGRPWEPLEKSKGPKGA